MSLRNAAGMSPDELSMQDARLEGQRAGSKSTPAGWNPYPLHTPEYEEWERGRFNAEAYRLSRAKLA